MNKHSRAKQSNSQPDRNRYKLLRNLEPGRVRIRRTGLVVVGRKRQQSAVGETTVNNSEIVLNS
jgi:hypothetical protein